MNVQQIFMLLANDFKFKVSLSSGKGGQHANKNATRVTLYFNILENSDLDIEIKQKLMKALKSHLSLDGVFQIHVQDSRSQLKNKEIAIRRFRQLLEQQLKEKPKRKKSKPSNKAIQKRLKDKRRHAEKKERRKGLDNS